MANRFIIANQPGVVKLTARAVLPSGEVITTQKDVIVTQNPGVQTVCYTTILGASTVQRTINDACLQPGIASVYYIGQPQDTIYATTDCAVIAANGFYKLDNGEWINVSGGKIVQRGTCPTISSQEPTFTPNPQAGQPILTQTATVISGERVVEKKTFTPSSPTTVPIPPVYVEPVIQYSNEPTSPPITTQNTGQMASEVDVL